MVGITGEWFPQPEARTMKLVKVSSSVKSYALYNAGAKPAQWRIVSDDGSVLFDVKGRQSGHDRPTYTLYVPGVDAPSARGLTFADLKKIVQKA
jgi:hypothetical protein